MKVFTILHAPAPQRTYLHNKSNVCDLTG